MPRQMIEPRRHHARRRTDREGSSAELRDARLQRKHPAIDARQRAAQAAVIGIEYGGGFRHRRTLRKWRPFSIANSGKERSAYGGKGS